MRQGLRIPGALGSERLYGNRAVLMARSPVFKAMLQQKDGTESVQSIVQIRTKCDWVRRASALRHNRITERQRTRFESSSDDSDIGGHSGNRASRPTHEPIEARFSRVRCLSLAGFVNGNTSAPTHACTHMHVRSHARTHTDSDAQRELGGRSTDSND